MIIKNLTKNFTTIPNELITDDLSLGAFKLYCYLASKPKNWNVYNDDIIKQLGISDKTLSKLFKELINKGWLQRKKITPTEAKKLNIKAGSYIYYLYSSKSEKSSEKENFSKKEKNKNSKSEKSSEKEKNTPHNNTKDIKNNTKYSNTKETTLQKLLDLIREFHLENKLSFNGSKSMSYGNTLAKLKNNYSLEDIKEVIEYAMKDSYGKKILANPNSFFNNFESLKVALEDEKEKYPQPEYVLDFYDLRLPEGWVL
jgi:hypothetical protein